MVKQLTICSDDNERNDIESMTAGMIHLPQSVLESDIITQDKTTSTTRWGG